MSKQFFQTLLEKYKNPTGDNFDGERPSFIKFIYPSKFLTTNNKLRIKEIKELGYAKTEIEKTQPILF